MEKTTTGADAISFVTKAAAADMAASLGAEEKKAPVLGVGCFVRLSWADDGS